jgi:hypothetical protein
LGLAAGAPGAAAHDTEGRLANLCANGRGWPCVYDAAGQPVGLAAQLEGEFSALQRPLGSTVYQILWEATQGFAMAAFLTDVIFTAPNCPASGPAYVLPNASGDPPIQVPQFTGQYDPDLKVIWGATSSTIQHNVKAVSRLFNGSCAPSTATFPDVLPAAIVDQTQFTPPFSVR